MAAVWNKGQNSIINCLAKLKSNPIAATTILNANWIFFCSTREFRSGIYANWFETHNPIRGTYQFVVSCVCVCARSGATKFQIRSNINCKYWQITAVLIKIVSFQFSNEISSPVMLQPAAHPICWMAIVCNRFILASGTWLQWFLVETRAESCLVAHWKVLYPSASKWLAI